MGTLWHYYDIGIDFMKWATSAYFAGFMRGDLVAVLELPAVAFLSPIGWLIALVWPLVPVMLVLELFGMPVLSGPYQSSWNPFESFKFERPLRGYASQKTLSRTRLTAPVMVLVVSGLTIWLVDLLGLY